MRIVFITRPITGSPNPFRMKCLADSLKMIDSERLEEYSLVIFSKNRKRIQIATFSGECTKVVRYSLDVGTFDIPRAAAADAYVKEIDGSDLQRMLKYKVRNNQHFK